MKAKINVQFNPKETPLSEIERKLKFIEKLPIDCCQREEVRSSKGLEYFKGFNVIFKEKNTLDIIPIGNVNITYFNFEELSKLRNSKNYIIECDNNCLTIYDNNINSTTGSYHDSYHFFYDSKGKEVK